MPTATMTVPVATAPTTTKVTRLPVSARKPAPKSAVATLRSLYPRAARAFLQRDVSLTQSLLLSAFSNLPPPTSPAQDPLNSHRRKWDILRITLETTLHTHAVPDALLAAMHARSLHLFTPAGRLPSAEFLPSQITVALALAALKLACPRAARDMLEDWLARRPQDGADAEGYEKALEVYCLLILPRLDGWDAAREFLRYEGELPPDRRMYLVQSLQALHAQHLEGRDRDRHRVLLQPPPSASPSASSSSSRTPTPRPRPSSPSPSITSASSTSTHTAVPTRPGTAALAPARTTTATPLAHSRTPLATAVRLPVPPSAPQMPVSVPLRPPSLLALLRASLRPHFTASRVTFVLLMALVPLVSFVVRLRRRRLRLGGLSISAGAVVKQGTAVEEARRRLRTGWWAEMRRAVGDAVRMAGGGLV